MPGIFGATTNTRQGTGYGGSSSSAPMPPPGGYTKNTYSVPVMGSPGGGTAWSTGGGTGTGAPAPPAASTYTAPPPMQTNTQENPQIRALLDEYKRYQEGLAAGSDADATNAMQRERDAISGMAAEAEQGGIARTGIGGVSSTMRSNQLQAGQRGLSSLNFNLASDARKQQLAALQGRGSLELGQAGVTQGQQNFSLEQWKAQQQAAQAAAQLAAMQQQHAFQNQQALASMYTGF